MSVALDADLRRLGQSRRLGARGRTAGANHAQHDGDDPSFGHGLFLLHSAGFTRSIILAVASIGCNAPTGKTTLAGGATEVRQAGVDAHARPGTDQEGVSGKDDIGRLPINMFHVQ